MLVSYKGYTTRARKSNVYGEVEAFVTYKRKCTDFQNGWHVATDRGWSSS